MVVVKEPERGSYLPAPAGIHRGVCADVVDLGHVDTRFGKAKPMIQFRFFIDEELPLDKRGSDGVPFFMVTQRYTASLHEKSNLRKMLTTWRGKPFTKEELKGFELDNVIGANCQIVVVHNEKEGNVYANVEAVAPLGRGMEKMVVPEGYVRAKDRPDWVEPYYPPATEDTYEDSYFENNGADDSDLPF